MNLDEKMIAICKAIKGAFDETKDAGSVRPWEAARTLGLGSWHKGFKGMKG